MKRLLANVHGQVQGVSFRYYTQLEAGRLGLAGWVRNERDGSVMVVAEGDEPALEQLLHYLRQGPPAARISRVDTSWLDATGEFNGFGVRWL